MEDPQMIRQLKHLGHILLDEYVFLDTYMGQKAERRHAYEKLAKKLKKDEYWAHFARMNNEDELIEAIRKLRQMIKKRKEKLKWLGKDKIKYAPNLYELQKNLGRKRKVINSLIFTKTISLI